MSVERLYIKEAGSGPDGWTFLVAVGQSLDANGSNTTEHKVRVPKTYWQAITGEKITPEELVRKSFEFLLAREPKEAILSTFSLEVVRRYFPEYEAEMWKAVGE